MKQEKSFFGGASLASKLPALAFASRRAAPHLHRCSGCNSYSELQIRKSRSRVSFKLKRTLETTGAT